MQMGAGLGSEKSGRWGEEVVGGWSMHFSPWAGNGTLFVARGWYGVYNASQSALVERPEQGACLNAGTCVQWVEWCSTHNVCFLGLDDDFCIYNLEGSCDLMVL